MLRLVALLLVSVPVLAQLKITTTGVPAATQYQSYSTTLAATGGTPPYTWSVLSSSGVSLPEGMSLNASTGVVSAPQVNGQGGYEVTIQVTDSASPSHNTATAALDFGVYSDTSLAGCTMFPVDSIFNQRVDQLPVDTNPAHQTPSGYLNSPLHPDFGHGFYPGPGGIPWMRVPANAANTNVKLSSSGQITGAGTFSWPFPPWPNAVIEGTSYGANGDDHHILILQSSVNNITGPQTGPCTLYETYNSISVPAMFNAGANAWSELAGSEYLLNSNAIATSTSTLDDGAQDSPGIPMAPLLLRYSEVPEMTQHPLRITTPWSTNWFVWPATGCCSGSGTPQGLLYRLKASVNWQATCPVSTNPQAATLLLALQQYGAYMSDHGSAGYMQGVPDIRWDDNDLGCIKKFHMSDLEVVDNSALEVSSISGQTKPYVAPATLAGGIAGNPYTFTFTAVGGNAATRHWSVSSGAMPAGLVLNVSTGALSGLIGQTASGTYNFSMTATDTSSGLSSAGQGFSIVVTTFIVTIQNTAVTVTSAPAGLKVTVDGASYTTPQIFSWVQGSNHTLSTVSPQGAGTRYVFANWSDGGAVSHSVMDPFTAVAAYTVSFAPQYLLTTSVSPPSAGTIAINPASSDGYYSPGTAVKLTASPAFGKVFLGFTGDLTGSVSPQSLTMSAALAVTAAFASPTILNVSVKQNGAFTQGQKGATYTITVSDQSAGATSGAITVTENLPASMTLVSMAGSGWGCTAQTATCTRSDSLPGSSSYPAITVTVNITANAPIRALNSVSVSGGGATATGAVDLTTIRRAINGADRASRPGSADSFGH